MSIAHVTRAVTLATVALTLAAPPTSYADPPPQAPAHGWRKKHDPNYVGYRGKKWDRDYGVIEGRCNRKAVGAVLVGSSAAPSEARLYRARGAR